MLERTLLLSQLLARGVGVLPFETDQVWMDNPMPKVLRLVSSCCTADAVRHAPTAARGGAAGAPPQRWVGVRDAAAASFTRAPTSVDVGGGSRGNWPPPTPSPPPPSI